MKPMYVFSAIGCCLFLAVSASAQPDGRAAGEKPADPIQIVADIPYADNDNPRQQVDLILPTRPAIEEPLPVVVFVHGGAWMGGDRRAGRGPLTRLVATGRYAGVSVGYRLSGEAVWPAQIHDCKAALRWVAAHGKEYGWNPDRIGLWGPSAGGHLVAMLGATQGDESLEGDLGPYGDIKPKIACVLDFFGPTDFLTIGEHPSDLDHDAANSPESRLLGFAIHDRPEASKAVSPLYYVDASDVPTLLMHGTSDRIVPFDQSKRLAEAMKKAGVETYFVPVEGAGHGFGGPEVNRRVDAFFEHYLWNKPVEISEEPIRP